LNDILKQRLVGALVLIALGVVFWPVIFVQSAVRDIAPAATEIILHDAPPEAEDSPLEDPAERPRLDDEGLPVAWVLQVISVSKKDKADQLTRELVDLGHKAYSRAIRRDEEVLYRVYIGPVFDRSGLLSTKRDIDERFTVNAIIARYVP
jgi:DedD protein